MCMYVWAFVCVCGRGGWGFVFVNVGRGAFVCVCGHLCVCVCVCARAQTALSRMVLSLLSHTQLALCNRQAYVDHQLRFHPPPTAGCFVSGSDKDNEQYGASSSDSEDEAPSELQLTGRRPSYTNYRPEFAAKTLAQARHTCALLTHHHSRMH